MAIKNAARTDLEKLYEITKRCARDMIARGIFQWDEKYPSTDILLKDIELGQIWKLEDGNIILGIIVLTEIEDEEYKNVNWLTKNGNSLYVHRLAVDPKLQGLGYAQKLMNFAEKFAKENNYSSIRLDTFSKK